MIPPIFEPLPAAVEPITRIPYSSGVEILGEVAFRICQQSIQKMK